MSRLAIIQSDDDNGVGMEMEMLRSTLPRRGYRVESLDRNRLYSERRLDNDCVVAGDVEFVEHAMKLLGIPVPPPNDYPDCLRHLLMREIWKTTFGDLEDRIAETWNESIFAKPAIDRKLFPGGIFRIPSDFHGYEGVEPDTPLVCSRVIPIISEFRVYVMNSQIISIENYDGDPRDKVDREVIDEAVSTLDRNGQSLAAYAIDFGLKKTGETVLIEMNDGYSIGTYYGIEAEDYADFTLCRWNELLTLATGAEQAADD